MQVLKDEHRKCIKAEALKLFRAHDYKSVSMRMIAGSSNMTVGNIYRYFKSKSELFDQLLTPTVQAVERLITVAIPEAFFYDESVNDAYIDKIIQGFLYLHRTYNDELYILIRGTKGSHLEHIVEEIVSLLSEHLENLTSAYNAENDRIDSSYIARLVSGNIIRNYLDILYHFDSDELRFVHMKQVALALTHMYFDFKVKVEG